MHVYQNNILRTYLLAPSNRDSLCPHYYIVSPYYSEYIFSPPAVYVNGRL